MLAQLKVKRQAAKGQDTGTPHPSMALEEQLCFALYAASLAMTKFYKTMLAPLSLTYPQYLVMLVMWQRDEQTVGTLGDRLSLDSGTLTPLLKRMEIQGLIGRERDPEDERRVIVRLTRDGKALKSQALGLPNSLPAVLERSPADIDQLIATLSDLRVKLSNHTTDA